MKEINNKTDDNHDDLIFTKIFLLAFYWLAAGNLLLRLFQEKKTTKSSYNAVLYVHVTERRRSMDHPESWDIESLW